MEEVHDPTVDLEMQLLSTQHVSNHDGGSSVKRIINKAVLVVRSVNMFLEGLGDKSPPVSRASSSKSIDISHEQDENAGYEGIKEVTVVLGDADQTVPLLITVPSSGAAEAEQEVSDASDGLATSSDHLIAVNQLQRSQTENISEFVRNKNILTLQEFGGVVAISDALGTDLVKGVSEEVLRQQQELIRSVAPARTFFHLLWEEIKNKTVLLLSLAAALSIVFEINEDGLEYGWHNGVFVLTAIVLQVLFASIHKYWKEQMARKKLQKQQERRVKDVHVTRRDESNDVCESELVCGDIVSLKMGCHVPGDGLFVDGEDLKLDYGSEFCITNAQKPFLSYGGRVISGNARMIITSTSTMMNSTYDQNTKFKLETHLDKLNVCVHYTRLVFAFLIILVLFLRYKAGKLDDENVYRPESMAEPTGIRSFSNTFEKIIKESKYTTSVLTKLLSLALLGLTEGVAFVVTLAIVYWNDHMLYGKATEQDPLCISKMAGITKICTDTFGDFTDDDTEVQRLFIGGEMISECETLSPDVVEAICDGIGLSKENAFLHGPKYKLELKGEIMKQRQKTGGSEKVILHVNGPVNEIMSKCTHYYTIQGEKVLLNDALRREFGQTDDEMKSMHKLTTVAVACKHKEGWVLVALLGLKDINKETIKAQVKACRECGIKIIIISNKKLPVLKDIAFEYGLITDNDQQSLVLTAEDFRKYTDQERLQNVNNICVLGEAFSSDKQLFVETLRENGGVVAFLGQRTDEAPALMGADVGIAMARWSTEKAIESSDMIIWGGSFSEIIDMVNSGKCIYLNIQSFLQSVLIATISSTLINFIQTAVWGDASLTIVQSLWVNSAVLFLGGLALLTKASVDKAVSLSPVTCSRTLITAQMTRNILLQVTYQVTCLVVIQTKGNGVMGSSQGMKTLVFHVFVICQFCNLFNARELQKKNFFRSIQRQTVFWVAIISFVVLHAAFVALQDMLGQGTMINRKLWAGCVLVGVLSWLVDWLGKCISWMIINKFINTFRST